MKRRFMLCAILSSLALVSAPVSAQSVINFSGNWTLRHGTGDGICASICTIEHGDGEIYIVGSGVRTVAETGYITVPVHHLPRVEECGPEHQGRNLDDDEMKRCNAYVSDRRKEIEDLRGWSGVWDGEIFILFYRPEPGSGERGESIELSIVTFDRECCLLRVSDASAQYYRRSAPSP